MKTEAPFQSEVSLQDLNSFGIAACAERFVRVYSLEQLRTVRQLVQSNHELAALPHFVLGGGSNVEFQMGQ